MWQSVTIKNQLDRRTVTCELDSDYEIVAREFSRFILEHMAPELVGVVTRERIKRPRWLPGADREIIMLKFEPVPLQPFWLWCACCCHDASDEKLSDHKVTSV